MTTDRTVSTGASRPAGTLFYQVGAGSGASRVRPIETDVARSLVQERAGGDRIALSGVGRWLARSAEAAQDTGTAGAFDRAALESAVRSQFLAEGGADLTALANYGPGGPDDRRRRSPYAGSADAALLDFAAARASREARRGDGLASVAAEQVSGPASLVDGMPPGGWTLRRGPDLAAVSGAALRLLGLYGEAAAAVKAA
jgi:hypothetical protein